MICPICVNEHVIETRKHPENYDRPGIFGIWFSCKNCNDINMETFKNSVSQKIQKKIGKCTYD